MLLYRGQGSDYRLRVEICRNLPAKLDLVYLP
jgi:hypothetical protein